MSDFEKNHYSPKGLLMWAHIFAPDTGGKYSDDKFKVKLRLYGDEAKKMIDLIDSFIPEASAKQDGNEIDNLPYTEATDKDKKVIAGAYDFTLKTKNPPQVIDAKKKRITKSMLPTFKDGSAVLGEGMVAFKPHSYTVKRESGIGLYLQAVQILSLSGGSVDLSQFADDEDGFVADNEVSSFDGDGEEDDTPDFASK